MSSEQRKAVVRLGESAITVTTEIDSLLYQFPDLTLELSQQVVQLVLTFQVHTCTHSCTKRCPEGQECRHFFPRPPSLFTLLATTPNLETPTAKDRLEAVEAMLERLQGLLRDQPDISHPGGMEEDPVAALVSLLHQVADPPQPLGEGYYSWAGMVHGPGEELENLLLRCGAHTKSPLEALLLAIYHCCLLPRRHAKLILVRNVSEVYIVNYNPWALLAWEANMELEIITHTPSSVYGYVSKGSGQKSLYTAITELRARGSPRDLLAARRLEKVVEQGQREVTLGEGMFRMDHRLSLSASSSSAMVIFVNTAMPSTLNLLVGSRRDKAEYYYSLRCFDI